MVASAAAQETSSVGAASIQSMTALLEGVFERDFIGGQAGKARQFAIDDRDWRRNAFLHDRDWSAMRQDILRAQDHYRADRKYQRAVADAQNAGLHPLFALGGGMSGGSPAGYYPGATQGQAPLPGSPVGGSARTGIAAAGRAIAEGIMGRKAAQLAEKRLNSQLRVDDANVNYLNSLAAKASQEALSGPRMTEDGATVIPYGGRPGIPLTTRTETARATRVEPHVNAPLWTKVEKPGGGSYRVLSSHVQADELNQLLVAAQGTFDYFQKAGEAVGFKPWELGRQAYTFFRNMNRRQAAKPRRGNPRRNF